MASDRGKADWERKTEEITCYDSKWIKLEGCTTSNLSGQLGSWQLVTVGHIAIMGSIGLVWRQIRLCAVASGLLILSEWACFIMASYAKNGTQIKLFMIWQGCFRAWQIMPNCAAWPEKCTANKAL